MAIVSIQSAYPPRPRGGAADRCRLRGRRGVGARPRQLGRAHRGGRGRRHQGAGVQPAAGTQSCCCCCCCWRLEDHDNQPRVTCLLHSRVNRPINIPECGCCRWLSHCVTSLTSRLSLGGVETTRFVLHIFISPLSVWCLMPGVCRLLELSTQFYIPAAAASSLHLSLGAEGRMLDSWAGLGWAGHWGRLRPIKQ